ncbi:MAG: F0F1 ATP synthase subunit A [Deltaproteobacteria bacterium]|nr:F0F1 ATP synthase subunit A [Deltaproteobacteria bacterium]MBW1918702.1 F0F1 ATP synthase subunit A [Deltaproteobacteria bacterium]MBW1936342.1 F0F1 ATP synthase subunit A [Deltaproteobacteria bacterium]MBW1978227.1 F0F1 ATP synthase subunit A [Deltaproteobacteria bacterium]MBW2045396.1 F0F1 ATP synthase subunit A [Deltaproteobacteria bacterium]
MEEISHIPQITLNLLGFNLVFNIETIVMTWIVMGILITFGFLATRKIAFVPNPFQVVGELLVSSFYDLTKDALGEDMVKKYFPLICSLFMFLLLSDWLGIIPMLSEPTKDLNTPLSLGIMGFCIAHYSGIKVKGIKQYVKGYCEPIIFMAPLNLIGELAKVISISFRLFGNIMGGAIIILVVSHLVYSLILPPLLVFFFGLFVGTIQAFVFTMLTLVYISLQVK